jgi:hypothetical protein
MDTIRRWVRQLVEVNVSLRTAVLLAVCSTALLLGMMTIWLGMSTQTALLDKQLEDLDSTQTALTDKINQTWTEIGELTSPRMMEPRARQLGFEPATQIEYLIVTPAVTPTLTMTETVTPTETLTATITVTQ